MGDYLKEFRPLPLTKDEAGVWSVVITDRTPDVYTYDFTVDGVKTVDPQNPHYKESENGLSNLFEVPGPEAEYLAIKEVPHGTVSKVWFNSDVTNN